VICCLSKLIQVCGICADKKGDLGSVIEDLESEKKSALSNIPLSAVRPESEGDEKWRQQIDGQSTVNALLTVKGLYSELWRISRMEGKNSMGRKMDIVVSMLERANGPKDKKYVVRTISQNLRIGATLSSVLSALARASLYHHHNDSNASPLAKEDCDKAANNFLDAYYTCPDLDRLVPMLLQLGPSAGVFTVEPSPGIPVCPMLARPGKGIKDVLKRFSSESKGEEGFLAEFKYDGQRAQIHVVNSSEVFIFSRHLEDSTDRWPDVAKAILDSTKDSNTQSLILDAELIAVDRNNSNQILSFQSLSTRKRGEKRKSEVAGDSSSKSRGSASKGQRKSSWSGDDISSSLLEAHGVSVCVFIFDIMYHNGKSLLQLPLRERRAILMKQFTFKPGYVQMAKGREIYARNCSRSFSKERQREIELALGNLLEESKEERCEGLMIKALNGKSSSYDPCSESRRSEGWMKLKRDYVDGMADTLDLVPIGAWWGTGRRAGLLSPFLMAVYDANTGEYQSVCRAMTGLTEQQHREVSDFYKSNLGLDRSTIESAAKAGSIPNARNAIKDQGNQKKMDQPSAAESMGPDVNPKPKYFLTGEDCKVWFPNPEQVWEIKGADFTLSPKHMAAKGLASQDKGISLRFPRVVRIRDDKQVEQASQPSDILHLYNAQNLK